MSLFNKPLLQTARQTDALSGLWSNCRKLILLKRARHCRRRAVASRGRLAPLR